MYYLSNINGEIGFKIEEIHVTLPTDVVITDDLHSQYLVNNSEGKQYKIKDISGANFDDIFEETIPEAIVLPKTAMDLLEDRLQSVEDVLKSLKPLA